MRAPALLLLLAACAEPPSFGSRIPAAELAAPPAALTPLGPVLAAADALPRAPAFAPALQASAQGLAGRAAAIPGTGAPDPALDARLQDLAARAATLAAPPTGGDAQRLAELEARAEALRAGGLTQEERERLLSGPASP